MKEILETPVDKTEQEFVLEQVEEAVIVQEEGLVEDLGDAEPPWESRAEENSDERIIYTLFGIVFSMFLVGSSYF